MADFKESEKIPSELAASIKAIHKDIELIDTAYQKEAKAVHQQLKSLVDVVIHQFEKNQWKQTDLIEITEKIDGEVRAMAINNLAPAYAVKMRNELNNIEKLSNRVDTIEETSFLPAAAAITETAVLLAILLMLFALVDPYLIGMSMFFTVTFLIVAILLLIRDMDNPFETGGKGSAEVDLSHIYKLRNYIDKHDDMAQ
jgi:hypothetical protein